MSDCSLVSIAYSLKTKEDNEHHKYINMRNFTSRNMTGSTVSVGARSTIGHISVLQHVADITELARMTSVLNK